MSIIELVDKHRAANLSSASDTLLMCPPHYYGIKEPDSANGSANDFEVAGYEDYRKNPTSFRSSALDQWTQLRDTFIGLGVTVVELEAQQNSPDMVFTADPSLSIVGNSWTIDGHRKDGAITILSKFSNEERQKEVAFSADFFERTMPHRAVVSSYFRTEGSGDNVYDPYRDIFWSGYIANPERKAAANGRSDIRAHDALSITTGIEVIDLPVSRPFFHIDTCLAPLPNGHIVFYEGGIQEEARSRVFSKAFADYGLSAEQFLIPVEKADAERLACNLVCIGNTVVMPDCSQLLQKQIRDAGYDVVTRNVSRFISAGGAVHCLVNPINQRRIQGGHTAQMKQAIPC